MNLEDLLTPDEKALHDALASIANQYGKFNTTLKSSADYELMVRLLYLHKIKVGYLHGTLVHMRIGGQSTKSLSNRLKANREIVLIAIKQGIDQRIWRDLPPIIHQDLEVVEA